MMDHAFPAPLIAKVSWWLSHLIDPDQVVEIRALNIAPPPSSDRLIPETWAGTFTGAELETITVEALNISLSAGGVYYTINPLLPTKHARQAPRLQRAEYHGTAKDADVASRCWFPVDVDPVRAPGHAKDSTTDGEKAAGWDKLIEVRAWLIARGWPEPIISDSGNGYHLLFRLAQPLPPSDKVADDDPIKLAMQALAEKFDTPQVEIDTGLFNPSRILKVPGTFARKGKPTKERPHRYSRLLEIPTSRGLVQPEQLRELAAMAPAMRSTTVSIPYGDGAAAGTASPPPATIADSSVISRARAYTARVPGAVAGQHGHDVTFRLTRILLNDFGLDSAASRQILGEWNLTCTPPWSDADLDRKVSQAASKPFVNRGWRVRDASDLPMLEDVLAAQRAVDAGASTSTVTPTAARQVHGTTPIRNFKLSSQTAGETTKEVAVGRSVPDMVREILERTAGWPRRVDGILFVESSPGKTRHLTTQSEFFGWLQNTFAIGDVPGIDWHKCGPLRTDLFEGLRASPELLEYTDVQIVPHEPRIPGVYYSCPRPTGGDGTALRGLLKMFSPATPEDEELLTALVLTLFWGGPPGARPPFFITSDGQDGGRGVGKSTAAQLLGSIPGPYISTRQDEKASDLITRLLSPTALGRALLLDNLKSLKFSNSAIEALITDMTISGHRMFLGEGSRPNLLTMIMTANAGSLGDDMAKRVIPIHLTRVPYTSGWRAAVVSYIETNRLAIIGDAVEILRRPATTAPLKKHLRWEDWCTAILAKSARDPDRLVALILERQGELNEDRDEAELIRAEIIKAVEISELVTSAAAESKVVWLSSHDLSELIYRATTQKMPPNRASRYVGSLEVEGLSHSKQNARGRGWIWRGRLSTPGQKSVVLSLSRPEEKYSQEQKRKDLC